VASHANPSVGSIKIFLRDESSVLSSFDSLSHGVVTVVLPDTSVMGLVNNIGGELVRELEVLHLDDFRSQFGESFVLSAESSSAFFSGGIHTEHNLGLLVGVGERVEFLLSLSFGLVVLEHVTSMSVPSRLGLLVVEESGRESFSELLVSEPLERVGFLTRFSLELHGSPFGVEVVHGVVPGSSGVGIIFPAVVLLGGGPVGNSESLENGTGLSVESNVTDALEHGVGVEVLGVQVMHDIRLLVEFVGVNVLNAEASISSFLNMESVGHEEEVGVDELDSRRNQLFGSVTGGEHKLDPALVTTVSNVVLNGSSDQTFAEEATTDKLVQNALFHWPDLTPSSSLFFSD